MKEAIKDKKFLISCASLMLTQWLLYGLIKYLESDYHIIDFYLDKQIPFIGEFVYIYNTFYPFVFIALLYLYTKDKDTYIKGIIAGIIGFLISYIIFLVYPTIMIRPEIPQNLDFITKIVLKITYFFDEPALNCFPSIHCLFSYQVIISYLLSSLNKKTKLIFTIYSLLVVISTLFIKQHYVFDAIGALAISLTVNLITNMFKLDKKILKKGF